MNDVCDILDCCAVLRRFFVGLAAVIHLGSRKCTDHCRATKPGFHAATTKPPVHGAISVIYARDSRTIATRRGRRRLNHTRPSRGRDAANIVHVIRRANNRNNASFDRAAGRPSLM